MSDLLAAVAPAPEPAAPQGRPGGDAPPGEPFAPVLEAAALRAEAPPGSPPAGDTVRTADAEDAAGSESSGLAAQIAAPVTGQPAQVVTPPAAAPVQPAEGVEPVEAATALPVVAAAAAAPVEQPPAHDAPVAAAPPPVAASVDAAEAKPAARPAAALAVEENPVGEAPVARPAATPAPAAPARTDGVAAAQPVAAQTAQAEAAPDAIRPETAPAPADAATSAAPVPAAAQARPQGSGPDQQHERSRETAPGPATGVQATAHAQSAEATASAAPPDELGSLEQPVRSARLHDLPQAVAATIRVASRADGMTVARIVMRPEELGEVRIRLDVGAQGVNAHVVADSPEAAAALTAALGELRRSLEGQGLSVLGLDVRHASPDEQRRSFAGLHGESGGRSSGGEAQTDGRVAADDEVSLDPTRLPFHGSRVDVLA